MRFGPLLIFVTVLATAGYGQSFCPIPVAEHPFYAKFVERSDQGSVGTTSTAEVQIARSQDGSTRCAIPQYGRPPDQFDLVDIAHGREIFFGCAQVVSDSRRGFVSACEGQQVTVRPFSSHVEHLTSADIELLLQRTATAPPTTLSEGDVVVERHVLGQRLIHDVLCIGVLETRQGTEPGTERGSHAQPVDRTYEQWISPVYGVMEFSSADRLHNTHTQGSFEHFRIGEPPPELLIVPEAYKDTLMKAVAASPHTVISQAQ